MWNIRIKFICKSGGLYNILQSKRTCEGGKTILVAGNWCYNIQCQSEINVYYEKFVWWLEYLRIFKSPLPQTWMTRINLPSVSIWLWEKEEEMIKVEVKFSNVQWKMTQNHIFLVFEKWGHQHQIILNILYTNWFAPEECLIEKGNTTHT